MNNTSLFFKLAGKFFQRYLKEFLLEFAGPFFLFLLSMFLLGLGSKIPIYLYLCIGVFVVIPVACYTVWKMTVLYYALVPASHEFLTNGATKKFKDIVRDINQKELIGFLGFCFVIILILTILTGAVFYAFIEKNIIFPVIFGIIVILINIPIATYGFQALYFKKDNENYWNVFCNCFTRLNGQGVLIMLFVLIINTILSCFIISQIIAGLFLPVYFSAICTFWYYSTITKKN